MLLKPLSTVIAHIYIHIYLTTHELNFKLENYKVPYFHKFSFNLKINHFPFP